jgi:hypothetical protein
MPRTQRAYCSSTNAGAVQGYTLRYKLKRMLTGQPLLSTLMAQPSWRFSVRTLIKASVLVVLSTMLVGIPVMAMPANPPSAPLGSVMQADRAHQGVDFASGGATIYDGDRLETQDDGILRARLGKSQLYMQQSTLAEVHSLSNGYSANLLHGTVVASSPEGQTFQLLANGATVRPASAHATVARVTWVSANELLLTSNLGAIQVTYEGDIKTIEPGSSVRMEIKTEEASSSPGPQGAPAHGGHSRAIYFVVVAAAVGTGIGIWRATVSSN